MVLATGPVDLLSNGTGLWTSENGSPRLAEITGTDCILNCIIAACLAAERDPVCAVLYAVALLEIAGELAASIPEQRLGLGSFHIRLLDQLSPHAGGSPEQTPDPRTFLRYMIQRRAAPKMYFPEMDDSEAYRPLNILS